MTSHGRVLFVKKTRPVEHNDARQLHRQDGTLDHEGFRTSHGLGLFEKKTRPDAES